MIILDITKIHAQLVLIYIYMVCAYAQSTVLFVCLPERFEGQTIVPSC